MFIKRGSALLINKASENLKEVLSDTLKTSKVKEEEVNNDFVFFIARAITADVPNSNGDYFPKDELIKSYESFVGKGLYLNHEANKVEESVGKIIDSWWVEKEGDCHVLCLCKVDKQSNPLIARKITTGIINSVSMGCSCEESECSICGKKMKSMEDFCEHMAFLGREIKTEKGMKKVMSINRGIHFSELSLVANPADETALLLSIYAKADETKRVELKKIASAMHVDIEAAKSDEDKAKEKKEKEKADKEKEKEKAKKEKEEAKAKKEKEKEKADAAKNKKKADDDGVVPIGKDLKEPADYSGLISPSKDVDMAKAREDGKLGAEESLVMGDAVRLHTGDYQGLEGEIVSDLDENGMVDVKITGPEGETFLRDNDKDYMDVVISCQLATLIKATAEQPFKEAAAFDVGDKVEVKDIDGSTWQGEIVQVNEDGSYDIDSGTGSQPGIGISKDIPAEDVIKKIEAVKQPFKEAAFAKGDSVTLKDIEGTFILSDVFDVDGKTMVETMIEGKKKVFASNKVVKESLDPVPPQPDDNTLSPNMKWVYDRDSKSWKQVPTSQQTVETPTTTVADISPSESKKASEEAFKIIMEFLEDQKSKEVGTDAFKMIYEMAGREDLIGEAIDQEVASMLQSQGITVDGAEYDIPPSTTSKKKAAKNQLIDYKGKKLEIIYKDQGDKPYQIDVFYGGKTVGKFDAYDSNNEIDNKRIDLERAKGFVDDLEKSSNMEAGETSMTEPVEGTPIQDQEQNKPVVVEGGPTQWRFKGHLIEKVQISYAANEWGFYVGSLPDVGENTFKSLDEASSAINEFEITKTTAAKENMKSQYTVMMMTKIANPRWLVFDKNANKVVLRAYFKDLPKIAHEEDFKIVLAQRIENEGIEAVKKALTVKKKTEAKEIVKSAMSAFDKVEKVDVAEGISAKKNQETGEIDIIDIGNNVLKSVPDAFGEDIVPIIKVLNMLLPKKDEVPEEDGKANPKDLPEVFTDPEQSNQEITPSDLPQPDAQKKSKEQIDKLSKELRDVKDKLNKVKMKNAIDEKLNRCKHLAFTAFQKGMIISDDNYIMNAMNKGGEPYKVKKDAANLIIDQQVKDLMKLSEEQIEAYEKSLNRFNITAKKREGNILSTPFLANADLDEEGSLNSELRGMWSKTR